MSFNRTGDLDRVLALTGATYRQLDHWCRRGYLHVESPGNGYDREWPPMEIRVAATMVRLVNAGLTVPAAERVARGERQLAPGVEVVLTS